MRTADWKFVFYLACAAGFLVFGLVEYLVYGLDEAHQIVGIAGVVFGLLTVVSAVVEYGKAR